MDSEKPDVQASWETAIARKHTKKPPPPSLPPATTTAASSTVATTPVAPDVKPISTDLPAAEATVQPVISSNNKIQSEPLPRPVVSLCEHRTTEVASANTATTTAITDEEKMRQMLLLDVLKKYSPKKEVQKSPRQAAGRQEIAKLIRKKKKKLGQKQQQDMGGPQLKKKKKKKTTKLSNNSMLSQQQQLLASQISNTEDISTELLSICMESNIETPSSNGAAETPCLLRIPSVMPSSGGGSLFAGRQALAPPMSQPSTVECDADGQAADADTELGGCKEPRLVVDLTSPTPSAVEQASPIESAAALAPTETDEKSVKEMEEKDSVVEPSEVEAMEPTTCLDGHHCEPQTPDSELVLQLTEEKEEEEEMLCNKETTTLLSQDDTTESRLAASLVPSSSIETDNITFVGKLNTTIGDDDMLTNGDSGNTSRDDQVDETVMGGHEDILTDDMSAANVDGCLHVSEAEPEVVLAPGHVDNKTFYYVDPAFPAGWCVMVKLRSSDTSLIKSDTYYYTPCGTRLRSKSEIVKFVAGRLASRPAPSQPPLPLASLPRKDELHSEDLLLTTCVEKELFEAVHLRPPSAVEIPPVTREENSTTTAAVLAVANDHPDVLREKKEPANLNGSSPVKTRAARSLVNSRAALLKKRAVLAVTKKQKKKLMMDKEDVTLLSAASDNSKKTVVTDDENLFKVPTMENLRMLRSKQGPVKLSLMKRKLAPPASTSTVEKGQDEEAEKKVRRKLLMPEGPRLAKRTNVELQDPEDKKADAVAVVAQPTRTTRAKADLEKTTSNTANTIESMCQSRGDTSKESEAAGAGGTMIGKKSNSAAVVADSMETKPDDKNSVEETGNSNLAASDQPAREDVKEEEEEVVGSSSSKRRKTRSSSESSGGVVDISVVDNTRPRMTGRLTRSASSDVDQQQQPAEAVVSVGSSTKLSSVLPKDSCHAKETSDPIVSANKEDESGETEDNPAGAVDTEKTGEKDGPSSDSKSSPRTTSNDIIVRHVGRGRPRKQTPRSQLSHDSGEEKSTKPDSTKSDMVELSCPPGETQPPVSSKAKEEEEEMKNTTTDQAVILASPTKRRLLLGPASRRRKRPRSTDGEKDEAENGNRKRPKVEAIGSRIPEEDTACKKDVTEEEEENTEVPRILKNILRCQLMLVNTFQRQLMRVACGHCTATGSFLADSLVVDLPGRVMAAECAECHWTTVRKITVAEEAKAL